MEHEVFVPVPAERLREALGDPVRVARAVPGLQQDAGAEPLVGRLKVRVGGHSITYRGSMRVAAHGDGSYALEADATEARGTGAVKLALTLRLRDTDGGAAVGVDGTVSADGRITELQPDAVVTAATRLLHRFVEALAAEQTEEAHKAQAAKAAQEAQEAPEGPEAQEAPEGPEAQEAQEGPEAQEAQEGPEAPKAQEGPEAPKAPKASDAPETTDAAAQEAEPEARPSVFDTAVPPPSLDPATEDFAEAVVPPAEAAHARRTMIGRSAEEVDHAPPRGRYAPVPAPQTVAASTTLRWAAPAAALVLASAIVVGRALRRRH
ncbi:SRPBCC domain-containing protein [Streptomyces sp. V3I7]|uniref:SRPBCC domain-containing protein n=1 Tax=Streptomyces sp. V3I7 TaxID=3042278 RepID=UPI002782239D|nr:SRPBCC domain-containing protein [Streptomyces sp. V3I7]MDQ0992058.1 carbon monoxide dehydrogenase subunit G [Streptomyces sp. V3I7]